MAIAAHIPAQTSSKLSQRDYARLNALVVEDAKDMASLLRGFLRELGVKNIWSVGTGEDAFDILNKHKIDIAIVDDLLPPLDGLSVVRAVRSADDKKLAPIPVIYVTHQRTQESIINARDAGVTEILCKPYSFQQLVTRMETAILKPREMIRSEKFVGPDRRRRRGDAPTERRRSADKSEVEADKFEVE